MLLCLKLEKKLYHYFVLELQIFFKDTHELCIRMGII